MITVADGREVHGKLHMKDIENIVNKFSHKDTPYYIECIVKDHPQAPNVLVNTYRIHNFKPQIAFLGTMLYKVDNKKGELELVYSLPADYDFPEDVFDLTNTSEEVSRSSALVHKCIVNS